MKSSAAVEVLSDEELAEMKLNQTEARLAAALANGTALRDEVGFAPGGEGAAAQHVCVGEGCAGDAWAFKGVLANVESNPARH